MPLYSEFEFTLDAAATQYNRLTEMWLGPGSLRGEDALTARWTGNVWCNPPYSHVYEFVKKASEEAVVNANVVVLLVPARTDTKWWHEFVWDKEKHRCREGVQVRFIKGRVKFIDPKKHTMNSAPFPSVVVVMR